MNPRLTLLTATRVLRQLRADPRSIALILVLPTLLLVLLYYIYEGNQPLFNRIAPVMAVVFPMALMFIITSVTMQRERATGSLERLWTTRLHRADLIGGYAMAFTLMAALQSVVLVPVMHFALSVDNRSPWWLTTLLAAITGITGVALGLFSSAFARTEFQAVQFMPVLIIPQVLLCGLLAPRDQLPVVLHWISAILPLSYAVDAALAATAAGLSSAVVGDIAICLVFGGVFLALAVTTLPRQSR